MVGSQARLDYAVLGRAVVLAQRLGVARTHRHDVRGAGAARMVRDGLFVFEDLGALAVKGAPSPSRRCASSDACRPRVPR
ncbi:MAG: hypothetical protein U0S36_14930 [Candidatus Nanopelagicales bacterium]